MNVEFRYANGRSMPPTSVGAGMKVVATEYSHDRRSVICTLDAKPPRPLAFQDPRMRAA